MSTRPEGLGALAHSPACRVCALPAAHRLGSYSLCERHYELATRERPGIWRVDLLAVGALVLLVVLAQLLSPLVPIQPGPSTPLIVAGIILSLVPAVIWLWLFRRQDRIEPEPRTMVIGVFVLGALVAAALGIPLLRDVFDVSAWMGGDLVVRLLGGFLVVGMVQALAKYAVVRFSAYQSGEFDEPTDGIIYGTAAGLGYATVLNIDFVLTSGGAALGFGAIQIAVTALAHGAFGGVVGYFMSGQRLSVRPIWWSSAGILLAAGLSSVFYAARGLVVAGDTTIGGVLLGPWLGLILAGLVAGATFAALIMAMRREIRRTLAAEVVA